MRALKATDVKARTGSGYPAPFRSRVLPREKRALGDAFGLAGIGVNLTVLPAGVESSMRHWHDREDEFVYVLDGEIALWTDGGEEVLVAGMCVGFKAGDTDAHQFINRGDRAARPTLKSATATQATPAYIRTWTWPTAKMRTAAEPTCTRTGHRTDL